MTFDEFISVITSDFADTLDEENASAFIAAADIETLHAARTRLESRRNSPHSSMNLSEKNSHSKHRGGYAPYRFECSGSQGA